jgi:hypothetical protein
MSTIAASVPRANGRTQGVPREHGFWVMLLTVTLSAALRDPGWRASTTALAVVAIAIAAGSPLRPRIRRSAFLQLSSALGLSAAGLPVALSAGHRASEALIDSLAWSSMFVAFTFAVWACQARSSRVYRGRAGAFTLLSIVIPAAALAAYSFAGLPTQAFAAVLTTIFAAAFAILRPNVKQMKTVGLSLAACAVTSAVAVAMG